jgi:FAD synthase
MIKGKIVKGEGEAKKTGYPTANISVDFEKEGLDSGVYAGKALLDDKEYKAAFIVKRNPNKAEIYLIDYNGGHIYDNNIEIIFAKKVSDIERLEGQSLQEKIESDVKKIKSILNA